MITKKTFVVLEIHFVSVYFEKVYEDMFFENIIKLYYHILLEVSFVSQILQHIPFPQTEASAATSAEDSSAA